MNSYGFKNPNNVRIWVGGSLQNGCSDLKIRWFQMFHDQRIFLLWMFGSWGEWVGHYKSEHCSDWN